VVYRDLDTPMKTTDVSLVWNSTRPGAVEVLINAARKAFPESARTTTVRKKKGET
jgi:hypothetical protein